MAYVNYVRESVAFMEYASDERISGSEQLLWHALFHVMNQRAKGSDWPEGFISIPNARILFYAQFGEDTLISARNKLKQRGLIDYMPGKKNKQSPQYKLNYLTAELCTDRPQNVGSISEYPGNILGNAGGNMPGIYINLNDNRNPNRNPNAYEDDVDAAADMAAYGALQACIGSVFREEMGREPTPAELRRIVMVALNLGMDQEVVIQAIGRAANMGARNPAVYAAEVMRQWDKANIHTVYELVESGCM